MKQTNKNKQEKNTNAKKKEKKKNLTKWRLCMLPMLHLLHKHVGEK